MYVRSVSAAILEPTYPLSARYDLCLRRPLDLDGPSVQITAEKLREAFHQEQQS